MCPNSILSTPLDRSRRAEQNGMVGDRTEDLDFGLQAKNFARDLGYKVINSDSGSSSETKSSYGSRRIWKTPEMVGNIMYWFEGSLKTSGLDQGFLENLWKSDVSKLDSEHTVG